MKKSMDDLKETIKSDKKELKDKVFDILSIALYVYKGHSVNWQFFNATPPPGWEWLHRPEEESWAGDERDQGQAASRMISIT